MTPVSCLLLHKLDGFVEGSSRTLLMKGQQLGRFAAEAQLPPARRQTIVNLAADRRPLGENVDMSVLLAGIDQRLGSPRAVLGRILRRIQPGRPGVAENVDVGDRIA